jgi:PAS domain S-box-containing protein
MDGTLKILFVEDVIRDAELNWREIKRNGIEFKKLLVDNRKDFLNGLKSFKPDIIISDYSLPQFDGMQALLLRNEFAPSTPFIIVTGSVNEEVAVECMKAGADDYVIKEHLTRLPFAIKEVLEQHTILLEKRAAELLLKENEEKLLSIFSAAPVGIGLLVNQIFTEINETFCKMTGYSRKELIGKNAEIIYASDERNESAGISIYRHIAEKGTGSVETRFKCKDGRILNIFLSSTPLDKGNLSKGVTFIAMDITEKKQAKEALLESEGKFKAIFQNSNDAIMLLNINGFFDCNPRTLELFKINTKKEFLKLYPHELSPAVQPDGKNSFEASQEYIIKAYQDGYYRFDWTYRRSDGEIFYAEVILSAFNFEGERVLQGTVRDITERKYAEDKIRHERRLLRTLIDNLPDQIYVLDKDCRKVIANKADIKNIGYENEKDVLGKTDIELFPGNIGVRGDADNKEVISSGKAIIEREEDFVNSRGERRWLRTTKIPLYDNDGKIAGLVGIGNDITTRKQSEDELIKAKDKAEESDRLKTAFLNNISHEIRTPMNAIIGFSSLINEPDADFQTRQSYSEIIMQSCDHLLSIITDIVDISNIEANLVKINKYEIDINSALKLLLKQFIPKANEKKLTLAFEPDLNYPLALVLTDGTKLIRIISNLISNALKFTNVGSVKFGYNVKNDHIEFFVSDTGIGIPQEHYTKIFERFFQVKISMSKLYEGTGLGLSISKAYVDLLGGKIWLESEPDKVTTFYFTIPFERVYSTADSASGKEPVKSHVLQHKKTILIAEDTESNFKLLTYFLSESNVDILRALNGKEAVEKCLSDRDIDLVLMDIKMPVMDGYTATKLIREAIPAIPIIVQTAYYNDREKAIACGCSGFISKPFDKTSLLKVIKEFI